MNFKRYFGYAHGMFWKLAALFSKFLFLIIIVPKLPDSVYAEYIFGLTITLFPGMFLSLGASEHLPIIIRGRREIMDHYAPVYNLYLLACAFFITIYLLTGSWFSLLAGLAATHMIYFTLAGLLRTIDPGHFEWLTNQPTILFLLACFAFNVQTVEQLIILFIATNLIVYLTIAHIGGVKFILAWNDISAALQKLFDMSLAGSAKIFSNLLLIADTKALILAPKLFLKVTPSDSLVMAINIGESLWQLAMVVVNRNYALYCNGEGSLRASLKSAVLLMTGMAFAGIIVLLFDIPIRINKLDWQLVGWSIIFFAGIIVFMEMRYYLWAQKGDQKGYFAIQILIALAQIMIVLSLEESQWMMASAIVLVIGAVIAIGVSFLIMDRKQQK